MTKEEFFNLINELNIVLNDDQKQQFELYCKLLLEYNTHTNITAIREESGVYLKHFYDSLTLVKVFDFNHEYSVLDVGSGGGFPGLVLAIAFPNLKLTLLDSNHKKSDFQKYIVYELNLNNVTIVNDRAESFFKENIKYDVVVARAVANLSVLSELCIPFVKKSGYFLAMKGDFAEEYQNAFNAITKLGGTIESKFDFKLPISEDSRSIIKIKKIKETPKEFPRMYDKIIKRPLK